MANKTKGILRIGTSNIVLPGSKLTFPAAYREKSRLNYYSSLFNSLEVNSSFYKVPMRSTFEKWSKDVPEDFRFTLKLWREITHAKNLAFNIDYIDYFLKVAEGIGNKKGCLLIQFPGKISFDYYNQVENMLERVQQLNPENEWKIAIEFRNAGWYVSETYELLDNYHASLVLHDLPKSKNFEINQHAPFVYIRLHGPKGDYRDSYSNQFLETQFQQIKVYLKSGKDVYVYFNNTIGNAFENASYLKLLT
jgi:uncharacterized protein YecE (DUF72 family)